MVGDMKKTIRRNVLLLMLLSFLISLIFYLMYTVNVMQNTSTVVNYTNVFRGAAQYLVRLETTERPSDELIEEVDTIINDLRNGTSKNDETTFYSFNALKDKSFQDDMYAVSIGWDALKNEIMLARMNGYENTDLMGSLEKFNTLSNNAYLSAQKYSTKLKNRILFLELTMLTILILFVITLIQQLYKTIKILHINNDLAEKAYIDFHTQLPNRSKCKVILSSTSLITEPTAFIMFDLNGLKVVNDTLGHTSGDILIKDFATILRDSIPEKHFVGRYGGDEFIAIIYNTSIEDVEKILLNIENSVTKFNESDAEIKISYSEGYAISTDYTECYMLNLMQKADKNMYSKKEIFYEKYPELRRIKDNIPDESL